jgi:hypothetical protein
MKIGGLSLNRDPDADWQFGRADCRARIPADLPHLATRDWDRCPVITLQGAGRFG